MATLLYRLGRWAYSRPWRVIVSWLLLVGLAGGLAVGLGGTMKNSFRIPGTESQEALDKLAAVFPQTAGATVTVVFQAPDGDSVEDEPYKGAIETSVDELADIDGVESAVSPFSEYAVQAISESERVALVQVTLTEQQDLVTDATVDDILATASTGEDAGLNVQFTGGVFQENSFGVSPTEGLGVLFAAAVLVVAFGSFLAAGMPLVVALVSVAIAMAGLLAAAAFTPVSSTAPVLGLMIGLAVGIDYSLFIISRHRNQLATGMDPRESAGVSVATAGSAVVFAGITVIIALLGLLVVGIPFLSVMGVGAAGAVLVAVLASVTLLPALLGLAGARLVPKAGSRAHRRALAALPDATSSKPSFGLRWVRGVLKAPIPIALGLIALLGAMLIPALQLQLSLPDAGSEPRDTSTRQAYDIIADEFGAGRNGPLVVLVDITQTTDVLDDLKAIGDEIAELDDVARVGSGIPNATLDTAIIQVIPESAPDSPETAELVSNIRALEPRIADEYDTPIQVTGATAVYSDISSTLMAALLPFGAIVVGLSIILLMMVFRSLFVPITAALGFLLSVIAAFGSVVAVFQLGYGVDLLHVEAGPILSFLPIILIAVLFGLAMDYQVFLVSGMREEFVRTGDAKRSVTTGFAHAARVVTAAALIMFFVFFSFVPEGMAMIKPIALGLAVGILVDAFLIRMTLIPALMSIGGRAAWYLPKWLDRILPDIDIEGTALEGHREGMRWVDSLDGNAQITAEDLVVAGTDSPLDFTAETGSIVLLDGAAEVRRAALATLAGRVSPRAGRAQVARRPLPSDAAAVARHVAVVDAGNADDLGATVHELIAERVALSHPWYAIGRRRSAERAVLDRAARALHSEGLPRIDGQERLDELPRDSRIAFAAAMGAAEATPVVVIDLGEWSGEALQRGLRLLDAALPTTTTIVVAISAPVIAQLGSARPVVVASLDRKAVLV
ncbi:MMPL family transporter [Herbiconiux sp. L3-i23]|uniref:MMPL family transporter n=1 Tax=Herbiconiux sp. L3-i23 TaxID=2905871 RepID=UPI00204AF4C9|nr:MMPL family transporter [Herbiconiux sp. L3-i23]BDI21740.1 RND transporter [Herbiconiux sp. L3-i23]